MILITFLRSPIILLIYLTHRVSGTLYDEEPTCSRINPHPNSYARDQSIGVILDEISLLLCCLRFQAHISYALSGSSTLILIESTKIEQ